MAGYCEWLHFGLCMFLKKKNMLSPNLLGHWFSRICCFLDPTCPFQVQWLCGTGWWVPWNFDWYPKYIPVLPLFLNVFIFANPCLRFEAYHQDPEKWFGPFLIFLQYKYQPNKNMFYEKDPIFEKQTTVRNTATTKSEFGSNNPFFKNKSDPFFG